MNLPTATQLRHFLRQTFYISLLLSLTVFAWLRIIFFEVPFSIVEDSTILLKTILFGWFMIMVIKSAWLLLLHIATRFEAYRVTRRITLAKPKREPRVKEVIAYGNTLPVTAAVPA